MRIAIYGTILGCLVAVVSVQSAAAFTTSPLCRQTFGYDKNGKKHCNLAEWEAKHRDVKQPGKKKEK